MVEVKLCSAEKRESMPVFRASSALTAYLWRRRRDLPIWLARRSVGVGLLGVLSFCCGASVIPEAGSGVVDEISWVDGSEFGLE